MTAEPNMAQLRREARADQKARQLQRYIEHQVAYPAEMVRQLFKPADPRSVRQLLLGGSAEWARTLPPRTGTLIEVATHEAGHFVASEALGLYAGLAKVYGSPFGRDGWGGRASADYSIYGAGLTLPTADSVWRDVVAIFAGPAAEHAIAGGNAIDSHGEFMILGLGAAWLARQRGTSLRAELHGLISDTARLIHGYRAAIETVADCLTRQHQISRDRPRVVARALATTRAVPTNRLPGPTAEQVADLVRLVTRAPIDLPALVRSIAK